MSLPSAAVRAVSTVGGQALRAATRVAAARPAAKPLHPAGSVVRGVLRRFGGDQGTGAPWLDRPGEDRVLVRQSRAVGLPDPLPDVFGLAIRVPTESGPADLLFASTGLGRLTRFSLSVARSPHRRPMTTLLPYRTPAGAVILSAVFHSETSIELAWALGTGPWHRFAELVLDQEPDVDAADMLVSFQPVENVPPGLQVYDWIRRLREPAYVTARRSRRP